MMNSAQPKIDHIGAGTYLACRAAAREVDGQVTNPVCQLTIDFPRAQN